MTINQPSQIHQALDLQDTSLTEDDLVQIGSTLLRFWTIIIEDLAVLSNKMRSQVEHPDQAIARMYQQAEEAGVPKVELTKMAQLLSDVANYEAYVLWLSQRDANNPQP